MNDLISVIVPFFNAERQILECCNSLKNQTYDNFEVLMIDDGSTDHSSELVRQFDDTRFRLVPLEKQGVSTARNVGLEMAKGSYFAFVDADDTVAPNYLQSLLEHAVEFEADIVICNYMIVRSGKCEPVILPFRERQLLDRKLIAEELLPKMIYDPSGGQIAGRVWGSLIAASFWKREQVRFHPDISMAEDLLFTIELYHHANRIVMCSDCLYAYRQNADSIMAKASASFNPMAIQQNLAFHQVFVDLLKKENLLEDHRELYLACKANMYTSLISNAARARGFENAYKEIWRVSRVLSTEHMAWHTLPIPKSRKLALWLLEKKCYIALAVVFKLKEALKDE